MTADTQPKGTSIRDFLGKKAAEAAQAASPRSHGEGRLLAIDVIDPNPYQHRLQMDPAKLDELMESIRVNGLIEPVPVRRHPTDPSRYQLIAGHRRHRSFQLLREAATSDADRLLWSQIIAVEKTDVTDRKMHVLGVVENADRDDTSPVEQGMALLALQDGEHMTLDELVQETGWAADRVKRLLRITKASQVIRDACTKGIMVQLYDDAGSPLMTPKGRLAQEHRTLDLMGALEFDQLHRHYVKAGASEKKASERIEKHITAALTDAWGYRRIRDYCRDQREPASSSGSAASAADGGATNAGEGTTASPAPTSPYRDDDKQLVVYKARLAAATPDQKAALRTALEAVLRTLQTSES